MALRDSAFRSQDMCLCQIIMPSDSAFKCVAEMGELELVHFIDLNSHTNAFDKKFINEIRTCDEIERQLRFIERELQKNNITGMYANKQVDPLQSKDLYPLKEIVEKVHDELNEVVENSRNLSKSQLDLIEFKHVLEIVRVHFGQVSPMERSNPQGDNPTAQSQAPSIEYDEASIRRDGSAVNASSDRKRRLSLRALSGIGGSLEGQASVNLSYIAGTIESKKLSTFELTIWRTTRGNAFLRHSRIEEYVPDLITGQSISKDVFLVFFQGTKLRDKIERICEGFQANVYQCPDSATGVQQFVDDVAVRQIDIARVISSSNDHYRNLLLSAAQHINADFIQVMKTKAVFNVLNMCRADVARQSLFTECWIPEKDLGLVRLALKSGSSDSGGNVTAILNRKTTNDDPPTFFKTNKLTSAYQSLVDAYGIAAYKEMNPVPFSIVSFPFLFSVMFGDFGHGIIMALMAGWMCGFEKKLSMKWRSNEVWQIIFSGRYIILLMSLFSIYSGLMYNDAISKSADIFGSQWVSDFDFEHLSKTSTVMLEPDPYNRANLSNWVKMYSGSPYIFGMDPIWALSLNKITYLNSLKMKMSIIIGVAQMILGLFLHLTNIIFFKRWLDIPFDFVPKIIFFLCMFIYLIAIIIYKWIHYNGSSDPIYGAACAPALLVHYINMFLFSYGSPDCSLRMFYSGQKQFQTLLVVLALCCIPLMLIPKPAIEIYRRRKRRRHTRRDSLAASLIDIATEQGNSDETDRGSVESMQSPKVIETPELPLPDMIMDHAIETIEFFLNSVSSAASYLRLWALSLAHAELAEVLWSMVMHLAYVIADNLVAKGILIYIIFIAWALLTVTILILMEGLSAFLHTLRLHWVEFQGKFYKGTGYAFTPLKLKSIEERVNCG